jgi:hypothetical protein
VKDGNGKQGGFKCGTTVSQQRENMRSGDEMTGSVGEHATDSSQPCRKGAVRGKITALEEAYEEYETTTILHQQAAQKTGLTPILRSGHKYAGNAFKHVA